MTDEDGRPDQSDRSVLERIADVLNVPLETFYEHQDDEGEPSETDMLAAFRALPGERERRLCLWFTRQLTGRQGEG